MITDQGRWDDRDYYDEHFYDIMYDKITEGMKLTVDEMDNLVSAGLFDKEIVPHEEYLEVNDNNQKMRTIVKLHDKYFEIRWTQYTHKDSEFPNDPVEVRKKPKIEEAEKKIIGLHEAYFDIKGNKGHASLVAGIDEEAGDVDSMYQLVLQRKGNLSAIEDEMDGK